MCSLPAVEFLISETLDMLQLDTSMASSFLAGNVAIAGATFKHHLLHFGETSLRGSNFGEAFWGSSPNKMALLA